MGNFLPAYRPNAAYRWKQQNALYDNNKQPNRQWRNKQPNRGKGRKPKGQRKNRGQRKGQRNGKKGNQHLWKNRCSSLLCLTVRGVICEENILENNRKNLGGEGGGS